MICPITIILLLVMDVLSALIVDEKEWVDSTFTKLPPSAKAVALANSEPAASKAANAARRDFSKTPMSIKSLFLAFSATDPRAIEVFILVLLLK
uniref:Uncharacterized protein n=1 Tax=mine drainage metagenome TaxID=410659 RepID=E6QFM5_9ZZZZ